MTSFLKSAFVALTVILVLLGVMIAWHYLHRPSPVQPSSAGSKTADDPVTQQVDSFDAFQLALASRVMQKLGEGSDDMSAIVATAAFPIGTLLRPKGAIPADWDYCKPSTLPSPIPAIRLFPSYSLSTKIALDANLGAQALEGLTSAGVNLKHTSDVKYEITETKIQILDDESIEGLIGNGKCSQYLSHHPGTRLIRGWVVGKVTFSVKVDNPASVQAKLAKGGFKASDNPDSHTISVSDADSEPIVELVSQFKMLSKATAPLKAEPVKTASVETTAPAQAHIYIEQDVRDSKSNGVEVVALLNSKWPHARVEPRVEQIPSDKVPEDGQVRFFNDSDSSFAQKCLDILRAKYPDMRAVRIGLASPSGQLEVWLPRVAK
jgi:hypothetical protein